MGIFDDVSDSISDKVGDVVNDAKEAAGDVTEGAGDVASEIGQGDIGGAIDEAQNTVEDVSSGQADTGSNDTSDDNFSSPSPSSGAPSSSGGSSGGQPSTGGSSTSSSSGPSIGDSSSADSSDSFDSGDDFDGSDSSGGGTSTGSSSGGSSSTRSPKETVKDKVGNQDSLGPQGSKSQSSSGLPDTVKGEISRVKSRISDLKKSMEDGTWAAGMKQDIKDKQEYLRELKRKNPNAPIDRTGNVIVSDPDGPGGSKPQKTLGSGDTWAEAEYNARVNTEGNRDFNQASEKDIANVAERRAEKAQKKYQRTANEIESAKQKIQNDQAQNYLINTQNIAQEDLTTLGISKKASGQVEVSESNLLEYYDQQLSQVRNQIENAEEQEKRFANFGQRSKKKGKSNQSSQASTSQGKSRQAKMQEVRSLVRENPGLISWGGNFNEAGDQINRSNKLTMQDLKNKDFSELQENFLGGEPAPKQARQRFKELQNELDLTKGQIDTIQGEVKMGKTMNYFDDLVSDEKQQYKQGAGKVGENLIEGGSQILGRSAAFWESTGKEAINSLPDIKTERKFDSLTEQQLYDTRTGRTATTAELTGQNPDYSPELETTVTPGDPFSVQDARTVSEKRVDDLAGIPGNIAGGLAALPFQAQRMTGQAQQLASGEMTLEEAKKGASNYAANTVQSIVEDPYKAGVTAVLSYGASSAVSKVAGRLGKTPDTDVDTEVKTASQNKLRQRSQGDVATGEGFAKAVSRRKNSLTERILGKGKYTEYETTINTPGIMAFDGSGYSYGRAVTRNSDGDIVNEENFVASSLRRAPDEVDGRVGESMDIGTKLDIEGGPTQYIDSDSTIAGVTKTPDYTEIARQSARRDTDADDLTRSRTRIEKQQDSDSSSNDGGTGDRNRDGTSGDDGGVPAGSGGQLELESNKGSQDLASMGRVRGQETTKKDTSIKPSSDFVDISGGLAVTNPVVDNAQSPQQRSGQMVQNKPGVDRRTDTKLVPQGIADSITWQEPDQDVLPFQKQRGEQFAPQDQMRNNPEGGAAPPGAFGVPGYPGRPRVPEDEEEERKSDNRLAEDQFAFGSRTNPIASGGQLLFGADYGQSSGGSKDRNQDQSGDPLSLF